MRDLGPNPNGWIFRVDRNDLVDDRAFFHPRRDLRKRNARSKRLDRHLADRRLLRNLREEIAHASEIRTVAHCPAKPATALLADDSCDVQRRTAEHRLYFRRRYFAIAKLQHSMRAGNGARRSLDRKRSAREMRSTACRGSLALRGMEIDVAK